MDSIGSRLVYAMDLKGLNANKISVSTGIHPSTVKNYMLNKGKPDPMKLDKIAEFLSINRDWLRLGTGGINDYNTENYIPQVSETIEVNYMDALTSSVMMVPLVNQYAYAGYMSGYGDNEFISELPKIPFIVDREYKGEYICFEVKGDSMECESNESINEGDILLCRNVRQDYWRSKLHISKWDFVIVHKTRGIVVKRITNHNVDTGEITLHSLNEMYPDYTVNLSEVEKLFNIVEVKKKRKRR